MPHADSALVPESVQTKTEFWTHVQLQLEGLYDGQRYWVSNLANASSVIYNSLLAFPKFFGRTDDKAVNWAGFYLHSSLFPNPLHSSVKDSDEDKHKLLLGPFCGKPACQFIGVAPGRARGVCAAAFIQRSTVLVKDVESYPGHIACDGDTKSEIVVPLVLDVPGSVEPVVLGVLDLDCLAVGGFDEEDQAGLEKIAQMIVQACDW
ncbi:hypothetical protein D9619_001485 [Psilocybe cf. subviscida]|uniref:GAF domain-containing protein n=1 Tax=Psilocybe cf. subviscida TaxID=2480587 RepID=A0A8H5BE42_9AGAR|nr:hypothetical protein D9619_001485 [Psilocybe cf. subviscida]